MFFSLHAHHTSYYISLLDIVCFVGIKVYDLVKCYSCRLEDALIISIWVLILITYVKAMDKSSSICEYMY